MHLNPDQYDIAAEDHSLLKKPHYGGTPRISVDLRKSLGTRSTKYAGFLGIFLTVTIIVLLVTHPWKEAVDVKHVALLGQGPPSSLGQGPPSSVTLLGQGPPLLRQGPPSSTVLGVTVALKLGNIARNFMDMFMEGQVIHEALKVEEATDPGFDKAHAEELYQLFYDEMEAAGEKLINVFDKIINKETAYTSAQIVAGVQEYEGLYEKAKHSLQIMTNVARIEVANDQSIVPTSQFYWDQAGEGPAGAPGVGIATLGKQWVSSLFGNGNHVHVSWLSKSRRLALEAASDYSCMQLSCGSAIDESMVGNEEVQENVGGLRCVKTMKFSGCFQNVTTAHPLKN